MGSDDGQDEAGVREKARDAAIRIVRTTLADLDVTSTESKPGLFSVSLPGTRKLITECAVEIGRHHLELRAFVARRPEQDFEAVYRWLLERNLRLAGAAFALDALGDIYLTGRVRLEAVTAEVFDELLGVVANTSDDSFNPILELGFADSIRREWVWRRSRGESTRNLQAFARLDPGAADDRA